MGEMIPLTKEEEEKGRPPTATTEKRWKVDKVIHQVIILSLVHILYIFIEAINKFEYQWLSSVVYGVLCLGTAGFLWLQKENNRFLIPIPFISLIVVGALLEETITTTIIFALYCAYFFSMQFIEKDEVETILVTIFSGITMVTLLSFTTFNRGFVRIDFELHAILGLWVGWCATLLGFVFVHRKNFGLHFGLILTVLVFGSAGPFFGFILDKYNLFSLLCGAVVLATIVMSLVLIFLEKDFALRKFLVYIGANLGAILIYSFSFRERFDWLSDLNARFLVDYVLLIPLVIITAVVLTLKFFPEAKVKRQEEKEYSYTSVEERAGQDLTFLIAYLIFLGSSVITLIGDLENFEFVFLKGLIISVIFVGATIPINVRISTTASILGMLAFFVTTLQFIGNVSSTITLIILLSVAGVILIFTVINELYLMKEPLTTNLAVVATLVGMTASIMLFYMEDLALKEILTTISWAIVGGFLFAFGIFIERLFLRRTGLMVIILDIVYSLIAISIAYWGWLMGIAYIILALVLLGCIYLFRWSESKEKKKQEAEKQTITETS